MSRVQARVLHRIHKMTVHQFLHRHRSIRAELGEENSVHNDFLGEFPFFQKLMNLGPVLSSIIVKLAEFGVIEDIMESFTGALVLFVPRGDIHREAALLGMQNSGFLVEMRLLDLRIRLHGFAADSGLLGLGLATFYPLLERWRLMTAGSGLSRHGRFLLLQRDTGSLAILTSDPGVGQLTDKVD